MFGGESFVHSHGIEGLSPLIEARSRTRS